MNPISKKNIFFRYMIIIVGILIFSSVVVVKLFVTTIIDAPKWNEKALEYIETVEDVEPKRGSILAANGAVLATDIIYYLARVDWGAEGIKRTTLEENLPALADSLEAFYPAKSAEQWREEFMREFERPKGKKNRYHVLFRNITKAQVERLKTFPFFKKGGTRSGFAYDGMIRRIKPYGSLASRSIGIVGETESSKSRHGRSGLEMALDSLLYGKKGIAKKIQLTNTIESWEELPAVPGYDILTTIDIGIQDIAEEALNKMLVESSATWGTTVVMEVATGEIKAICNLQWDESRKEYVEGRNHAVLGYEPGSVMKPITMMIALEDGLVSDVEEMIPTGYEYYFGGAKPIKDDHAFKSMPVRRAIECSSNIAMSKILLRGYGKKPSTYTPRLEKIGFFEPLNTGIAGEQVPSMLKLGDNNWDAIAISRIAYGYAITVPALTSLAMYNAIANDGKFIKPSLVKALMQDGEIVEEYNPVVRNQVCSAENAAKLKSMLHDVVWGEHGTARLLRSDDVEIVGKTGTTQIVESTGYNTKKKRYSFCGFFPYNNPKYSCITVISGADRGASRCSGLVVKEIAHKLYSRGMLGLAKSYKIAEADAIKDKGVLYATSNSDKEIYDEMKNDFYLDNVKVRYRKENNSGGVPNVEGLGLYDAINLLENSGLNVIIHGSGYVSEQSLSPGAKFQVGDSIEISLKQ